jgi:hypothetical protein
VVREVGDAEPDLNVRVAAWSRATQTGHLVAVVPGADDDDEAELAEYELDGIVAGLDSTSERLDRSGPVGDRVRSSRYRRVWWWMNSRSAAARWEHSIRSGLPWRPRLTRRSRRSPGAVPGWV